jgi:hypothetical protein
VGGAAVLISSLRERGEGRIRRRRRLMSFIKIVNLPMKFSMEYCGGKYHQ